MTNQDINNLIVKYQETNNEKIFEILLKQYEGMIYNIIHKYKKSLMNSQEDLYQISSITLLKALETFDVNKECKFSTYSSKAITNEINKALRLFKTKKRNADVKSLDYVLPDDEKGMTIIETIRSNDDTEEIIMKKVEKEFILDYLEYCKEKTPRRYEQVELLLKGYNTLEVAEILECSHQTISQNFKRFCKGIKEKAIIEGIVEI